MTRDWASRRKRYERDVPAVQLGNLASNLSRLAWFARQSADTDVALVFRESKYFTEWAAPHCSVEQQALLAELQRQLADWERQWGKHKPPSAIAQEAQQWSGRLLESSGLGKWERCQVTGSDGGGTR